MILNTRTLFVLLASLLVVCQVPGRGDRLGSPTDAPRIQHADELLAVGRKVFRQNCVHCHFIPDRTIERDKVWTQLIKTTA